MRFDYFPPSFDSPFRPLATARCSEAESFTRSEPRAVGTTSYVSTNPTHTREARGPMRVRSSPDRRVRGRKTNLRWARARRRGAPSHATDDHVCDRAVGFLDTKRTYPYNARTRERARALSGACAPPLSRVRRFTESRCRDPSVDTSRNGAPSHARRAARFARVIGGRAYLRCCAYIARL